MFKLKSNIMALINCPECKKEISDKAKACPNCGCPIGEINIETELEEVEPFPEFPLIMNVGKQIVNWGFDAAINGSYFHSENVIKSIPEGDVIVTLHTNGICISKGSTFYYISSEQITNMTFASQETIIEQSKSVIGRAVVGNLIIGPLGAIVGGMSGIGNKSILKGKFYLIIYFWDVYTHKQQTILVCTKDMPMAFINRFNIEKIQNNIPDGDNYVLNVFNDDQSLNEDKVAETIKSIPFIKYVHSIQMMVAWDGSTDSFIYASNKVTEAMAKKGLTQNDVQSSGCMGVILIILTTTLTAIIASCSLL